MLIFPCSNLLNNCALYKKFILKLNGKRIFIKLNKNQNYINIIYY